MNKDKILNAEDIKAILIDDVIMEIKPIDIIISELPFLVENKQLADLVYISDYKTTAFEIKSEKDNLDKLLHQIKGYLKIFNSVYVVIHNRFIKSATIKRLPDRVGIFVIDEHKSLILKRKAGFKHILSKDLLVSLLWKQELDKIARNCKLRNDTSLKKQIINKFSNKDIQKIVVNSVIDRFSKRFFTFINERGKRTNIEDIKYLRVQSNLPLPSLTK